MDESCRQDEQVGTGSRLTPPSSPSFPRIPSVFDDSLSASDNHPTIRPSTINITLPGINTIMKAAAPLESPLSATLAPPTPLSAILPPFPLASSLLSSQHSILRLPSIDTFTQMSHDPTRSPSESDKSRNQHPRSFGSASPPPPSTQRSQSVVIKSNESSPTMSPYSNSGARTSTSTSTSSSQLSSRTFKPRSKGKPHACPVCGRVFYRISNLNTHIVTHTGDKKHVCDFIIEPDHVDYVRYTNGSSSGGRELVWQNDQQQQQQHQMEHISILPIPSSQTRSTSRSSLSPVSSPTLVSAHSPPQPRRCNQRFARIYDLERHKRCHTRQLPYACALCPEQFIRNDPLWRHYKKAHPNDPRVPERKQAQYARKAALSRAMKAATLSDDDQERERDEASQISSYGGSEHGPRGVEGGRRSSSSGSSRYGSEAEVEDEAMVSSAEVLVMMTHNSSKSAGTIMTTTTTTRITNENDTNTNTIASTATRSEAIVEGKDARIEAEAEAVYLNPRPSIM